MNKKYLVPLAAGVLLAGCGSQSQATPSVNTGGPGHYEASRSNQPGVTLSTDLWADPNASEVQRTDRFLATITDGQLSGLQYAFVRTDNTGGRDWAAVNGVKVVTDTGEQVSLTPAFKLVSETCAKTTWDMGGDTSLYNSGCVALYNELNGTVTGAAPGKIRDQLYVSEKKIDSIKKVLISEPGNNYPTTAQELEAHKK